MGSSYAGSPVLYRLVRYGELSEVVAKHVRLYLHLIASLAVVYTHQIPNHLWDHDHVAEMGLDTRRLLLLEGVLLSLSKAFDQSHWLPSQSSDEATSRSGVD